MHVRVGCPEGYEPLPSVVEQARRLAERNGARVELTHDPREAVAGADVVYTDSWVSMGQEAERELRIRVFPPYQVNARLLQYARPDAVVMHCLPAHRGEEITDDVMDGPQSIIFDQAENRLHAQKALLVALIRGL
jgi:ornithine carbamoyltransferase